MRKSRIEEGRLKEAITVLQPLLELGTERHEIRKSISESIACLTDKSQSVGMRAANAIDILKEEADNSNASAATRVALWRALSELELVRG